MKGVTFHAKGQVEVETVADPRIEAPTDVIVRNHVTAICGSDLHVYHAREKGIEPGTVMGHEFLGEVVETGSEVRGITRGDVVVSPFTTSCGRCFYCRSGLTCRCTGGQLFGWVEKGKGLHGAQSELVRVPLADTTLVKVPVEVEEEVALFTGDILATGFFCAELAEVAAGGSYAVVGCGPVGLFAVVGARERGAEPESLFAIDVVHERLALAERFGATPVDAARVDPVAFIRDRTEGRGADAVMEAVGSPEATRLAVDLARAGGTVAAVGVHTEAHFAFSPVEAYDKNLTYRAGRCPARRFIEPLMRLVASRRYDLGAVISHRLPITDAVRGYRIFDSKLEDCTKVLLVP